MSSPTLLSRSSGKIEALLRNRSGRLRMRKGLTLLSRCLQRSEPDADGHGNDAEHEVPA
jgi:hypothetical protein